MLSAGVQDRDGVVKPVLLDTYLRTQVRFVFADGVFTGRLLDWATTTLRTTPHIVRKLLEQRGFAVIPHRWAVERTFSWITAHRRLAFKMIFQPCSERGTGLCCSAAHFYRVAGGVSAWPSSRALAVAALRAARSANAPVSSGGLTTVMAVSKRLREAASAIQDQDPLV